MNGKIFDDIMLSWRGTEYKVPANKVMGAIKRIEDHVTVHDLLGMTEAGGDDGKSMVIRRTGLRLAMLASGYAAVLNYAGADLTEEEVYQGLFEGKGEAQANAVAAISGLLQMMIPIPRPGEETDEKN